MKSYFSLHHIVLLLILGCGILMFYYTSGNQMLQLASGIVTAVLYVVWGIAYHSHSGDLHKKIVIEYLLIGAIAIMLLLTLAV